LSPASEDIAAKQLQFCQSGLIYLNQSLSQNDANNHERLKNYLMCLHQKAHLLFWHQKILKRLRNDYEAAVIKDVLVLEGKEMDQLRQCLIECEELSKMYGYEYMQLLVGKSYTTLEIDDTIGKDLIKRALDQISSIDRTVAEVLLARIDNYSHL